MVQSGDIVIVNARDDADLFVFAKVVEVFKPSHRYYHDTLVLTFYQTIETRTLKPDGKTIVSFRPNFDQGTRGNNYEFNYVKAAAAWIGTHPTKNNLYTECTQYEPSKSYYIAFYL